MKGAGKVRTIAHQTTDFCVWVDGGYGVPFAKVTRCARQSVNSVSGLTNNAAFFSATFAKATSISVVVSLKNFDRSESCEMVLNFAMLT
jgi:hypothetical protein